ncbi:hypothetical protein [Neoroseomonas rubea]|uniref:hypothetical protein n=1 Tax=Neoroseomonas rubea TaxID=2748666 RepID=UPI0018E04631|nr:hypothetical protein [Roseomonas rubea]
MKPSTAALFGLALLCGCEAAPGPSTVNVPPSGAAQAFSVYWLDRTTCLSRLRSVTGVTVIGGDAEGLDFSLQAAASVVPWQCPSRTMPGAHVMVRQTRPFPAEEARDITLRVDYDTVDGQRASTHPRRFVLAPAGR